MLRCFTLKSNVGVDGEGASDTGPDIAALLDAVALACHPLRTDVSEVSLRPHKGKVKAVGFPFVNVLGYHALLKVCGTHGWCVG